MLENIDTSLIDWSRAQFALTAIYHWIFVPLTLGLAVIMGIMETVYYRTGDEFWKHTAKFWMKLFGINFAIGVATGLILEFEFGTNWSNYSWFVGDILRVLALLSPPGGFWWQTPGCRTRWAWNSIPIPPATKWWTSGLWLLRRWQSTSFSTAYCPAGCWPRCLW